MVAPKSSVQVLTPGTCECDITWKKQQNKVFADVVKDFEMKSSSCIILVGHNSNGRHPYKDETGSLT